MDINDIYTQVLIENSKNKENKREIEGRKRDGINPSCGDELKIMVKLSEDKKIIEDISFIGTGCAISEASANIMCAMLKGKKVEEAKKTIQLFLDMIFRKELDDEKLMELEDAYAFKNVSLMPARVKCATLAWHTLDEMLKEMD